MSSPQIDEMGDNMLNLHTTNFLLVGRSPLTYMLGGGLLAMQSVRKLLDARRGGL